MDMKFRVVLLGWMVLSGCASLPAGRVDALAATWVGAAYDDLVGRWGAPTSFRRGDDGIHAVWENRENEPDAGGTSVAVGIGAGSYGRHGGVGVGVSLDKWLSDTDACVRQVDARTDGTVVSVRWRGDNDYCARLLSHPEVLP
jgi:hypothetical protein